MNKKKWDILERELTTKELEAISFDNFKFIPRRFFRPDLHPNYKQPKS